MHLCYLDEAGCTGALKSATDSVQPVFILSGLFIPAFELEGLTRAYIALKHQFYPESPARKRPALSDILREIKGADLRRHVREGRRPAIAFLHKVIDLLEEAHAKFVARVYVKGIGQPIDGTAMYTAATQAIMGSFQDYLTSLNGRGIVIADSRTKAGNVQVAHSVFTQKLKADGDRFNRILELPLFANSDNHAGLQLCDLLCSGMLFPIAAYSYCLGHVTNIHVHADYVALKRKYGPRLLPLQYQYRNEQDKPAGGVTVSDGILQRSSSVMFR